MKILIRYSIIILLLTGFVIILHSCKKEELPTLSTASITNLTSTSASSGGNITSDGGAEVSARGVCWSTNEIPTTSDSKTDDGIGTGQFVSNINGLTAGSTYHIRAYATNSVGTAYGNDLTFTTLAVVPTVTTTEVSAITQNTAISGGNVTANGGDVVTARGVCWGTSVNPTVAASHTSDGTGTGIFISNLTGLSANTTYYIRTYATNIAGTAYGNELNFKTPFANCGTVTDVDGNIYNTVIIGSRCWMAENLKTTKLNDGTDLLLVTNIGQIFSLDFNVFCWYNFDPGFKDIYGALYSSYAVFSYPQKNICPVGWHPAYDSDWLNMLLTLDPNASDSYLHPSEIAGAGLKATGTIEGGDGLWHDPNTGATNESGFTALPGGYFGNDGFAGMGYGGSWWIKDLEQRVLSYNGIEVTGSETDGGGRSIRCVKD